MVAEGAKRTGTARRFAAILAAGLLYFCFVRLTGKSVPCLFHRVTGFLCPGCGITTMIMALSRLDFEAAYRANSFLFVTAPFLLAEILYGFYLSRSRKKNPKFNEALLILYLVLLLGWGVIRNVPGG